MKGNRNIYINGKQPRSQLSSARQSRFPLTVRIGQPILGFDLAQYGVLLSLRPNPNGRIQIALPLISH